MSERVRRSGPAVQLSVALAVWILAGRLIYRW
jgi:hypothetical protein